ncbi:ribosome-associated heat shock protein Hsp15 [Sphingomonas sp. BE123]|jgi:ribosome-associated heat shock protein Hsp15|uniref:RNA-binding S4 domain-containing protein n=1 Tax=Sphingomonas sp. BE123 TaxID=2817842 RepID=UPI0028559E8E|nr:RNA-binding S4 domain-containing protein [Sphingomonas sp. BE123]MDR6852219.1 ribosome-associated heat shock protein Hsp15 [Sphingomonas sp. BE123]
MTERPGTIRVDRFLWFARLVKTRSAAQDMAEAGTLRIDGRRIERSSAVVRIGSILAFPLRGQVRVLRVEALPQRRGPASEAATLYQELLPGGHAPAPCED